MPSTVKPEKPKFPIRATVVYVIVSVVVPVLAIVAASQLIPLTGSAVWIIFTVGGLLFIGGTVLYGERIVQPYKRNPEDYELSEEDFQMHEQRMIRKERMEEFKAKNRGAVKECPNCGPGDIHLVSRLDKILQAILSSIFRASIINATAANKNGNMRGSNLWSNVRGRPLFWNKSIPAHRPIKGSKGALPP